MTPIESASSASPKEGDSVQLIVSVEGDCEGRSIPSGTAGWIVEHYHKDGIEDMYAVDVWMPDPENAGERIFDNVLLRASQFAVVDIAQKST